ncbi:MAG: response regulator, partial [Anaerolineae bacterium]|nr:response regulator [Anaerolineae bacterium]
AVGRNGASDEKPLSFAEIARQMGKTGGPIVASASVNPPSAAPGFGVHLCDLEVDPETGCTKILRYTVVQDAGNNTIQIVASAGEAQDQEALVFPVLESLLATQRDCAYQLTKRRPLTLDLRIPHIQSVDMQRTILFVDDNADLADLFSSYCTGMPYTLVHINQGSYIQQTIDEIQPDLIILDVILPDIDGWELLIDLQANPATSQIPVIVCSVVADAHLATDLGARLYLQKPVWRQPWLDAVASVLDK